MVSPQYSLRSAPYYYFREHSRARVSPTTRDPSRYSSWEAGGIRCCTFGIVDRRVLHVTHRSHGAQSALLICHTDHPRSSGRR
eukprot:1100436-Prorocentrum_minimum.AAC.1